MGCGNSRGVSSGIFIHIPSNTPRSWSTQYLEKKKKHNRETRDSAALALCSLQEAAVLLLTPRAITKTKGSILTTFFLHPQKTWRWTGCFFKGETKHKCYRVPALATLPQPTKRGGKKAGSAYLIVWVWNRGRTLRLLTCNRGKEGSSLVTVPLTARWTFTEMIPRKCIPWVMLYGFTMSIKHLKIPCCSQEA